MMYLLLIWRSISYKPLQSLLNIGVTGASVAMALVVMLLAGSVHQGLVKAAEPFDLIVGAKGSPNQLLLNTVFLQDTPIGNMEYTRVRELEENPAVAVVIPLGFGDNYRGYRMVGADERIFQHKIKPTEPEWLRMAQGRPFQGPMEAVIGAKTAAETGLRVGDRFQSSHGVTKTANQTKHEDAFTVVGILEPLHGPYDAAVIVPLSALWHMHETHGAQESREDGRGVTAILVKPKGYAEALALYQQYQKHKDAQLIFPSQTVVQLFALLGEGEKILKLISGAVFLLSMIIVALSLYWSALHRARERAILRAVGARRRDMLLLILGEGISLTFAGVGAGAAAAWGAFALLAAYMEKKTALTLSAAVGVQEIGAVIFIFAAGVLCSLLPAARMAKTDIAKEL